MAQPLLTDSEYQKYTTYLEQEKLLNETFNNRIIDFLPGGKEQYDHLVQGRISLDPYILLYKKDNYKKLKKEDMQERIKLEDLISHEELRKGRRIRELLNKLTLTPDEFNMLPPSLQEKYEIFKYTTYSQMAHNNVEIIEYKKKTEGGVRKTRRQRKKSRSKSRSKSRLIKSRRPSLKY
jgi:hypothetical protein